MQAAEYGLANQKVPDIQLNHLRYCRDGGYSVESQPVASMDLKSRSRGETCTFGQSFDFTIDIRAIAMQGCFAIGAGVKFDNIRPNRCRSFNLVCAGVDKQRNPNPLVFQMPDKAGQLISLGSGVKSALGGYFLAVFGDEATGIGNMLQGDVQHLARDGHLQIERLRDLGHQPRNVVIGNMAAVFAQMGRNTVRAGFNRKMSRADGVRMPASPRITDRGNVIDIHAQP